MRERSSRDARASGFDVRADEIKALRTSLLMARVSGAMK